MPATEPRKGMPSPKLDKPAFRERFLDRFRDPAFRAEDEALNRLIDIAWDAYQAGRKAPITRKAGPEFADPDYDLATDWLAARAAIQRAQQAHDGTGESRRVLVINASSRSEHTCPGEMSKSWRLAEIARSTVTNAGCTVEVLDLSRLAS